MAWDKPVEDYRSMLIAFSKDVPQWTAKTRALFFKQKTAYGILRSDWSSDVCSSD
eukprot:COSAG01_NODE_68141_length_265_cov_0.590361_1_plen_54_part_01